ncbi:hypothetical protein DMUE_1925 [Dictyocoela muelleri]|nr:hypothetical protein DMUE_1925 [Dictyocoela muelleri]
MNISIIKEKNISIQQKFLYSNETIFSNNTIYNINLNPIITNIYISPRYFFNLKFEYLLIESRKIFTISKKSCKIEEMGSTDTNILFVSISNDESRILIVCEEDVCLIDGLFNPIKTIPKDVFINNCIKSKISKTINISNSLIKLNESNSSIKLNESNSSIKPNENNSSIKSNESNSCIKSKTINKINSRINNKSNEVEFRDNKTNIGGFPRGELCKDLTFNEFKIRIKRLLAPYTKINKSKIEFKKVEWMNDKIAILTSKFLALFTNDLEIIWVKKGCFHSISFDFYANNLVLLNNNIIIFIEPNGLVHRDLILKKFDDENNHEINNSKGARIPFNTDKYDLCENGKIMKEDLITYNPSLKNFQYKDFKFDVNDYNLIHNNKNSNIWIKNKLMIIHDSKILDIFYQDNYKWYHQIHKQIKGTPIYFDEFKLIIKTENELKIFFINYQPPCFKYKSTRKDSDFKINSEESYLKNDNKITHKNHFQTIDNFVLKNGNILYFTNLKKIIPPPLYEYKIECDNFIDLFSYPFIYSKDNLYFKNKFIMKIQDVKEMLAIDNKTVLLRTKNEIISIQIIFNDIFINENNNSNNDNYSINYNNNISDNNISNNNISENNLENQKMTYKIIIKHQKIPNDILKIYFLEPLILTLTDSGEVFYLTNDDYFLISKIEIDYKKIILKNNDKYLFIQSGNKINIINRNSILDHYEIFRISQKINELNVSKGNFNNNKKVNNEFNDIDNIDKDNNKDDKFIDKYTITDIKSFLIEDEFVIFQTVENQVYIFESHEFEKIKDIENKKGNKKIKKESKKDNKDIKNDNYKDIKNDNYKDIKNDNYKNIKNDNYKDIKNDNYKNIKNDNKIVINSKNNNIEQIRRPNFKKDKSKKTSQFEKYSKYNFKYLESGYLISISNGLIFYTERGNFESFKLKMFIEKEILNLLLNNEIENAITLGMNNSIDVEFYLKNNIDLEYVFEIKNENLLVDFLIRVKNKLNNEKNNYKVNNDNKKFNDYKLNDYKVNDYKVNDYKVNDYKVNDYKVNDYKVNNYKVEDYKVDDYKVDDYKVNRNKYDNDFISKIIDDLEFSKLIQKLSLKSQIKILLQTNLIELAMNRILEFINDSENNSIKLYELLSMRRNYIEDYQIIKGVLKTYNLSFIKRVLNFLGKKIKFIDYYNEYKFLDTKDENNKVDNNDGLKFLIHDYLEEHQVAVKFIHDLKDEEQYIKKHNLYEEIIKKEYLIYKNKTSSIKRKDNHYLLIYAENTNDEKAYEIYKSINEFVKALKIGIRIMNWKDLFKNYELFNIINDVCDKYDYNKHINIINNDTYVDDSNLDFNNFPQKLSDISLKIIKNLYKENRFIEIAIIYEKYLKNPGLSFIYYCKGYDFYNAKRIIDNFKIMIDFSILINKFIIIDFNDSNNLINPKMDDNNEKLKSIYDLKKLIENIIDSFKNLNRSLENKSEEDKESNDYINNEVYNPIIIIYLLKEILESYVKLVEINKKLRKYKEKSERYLLMLNKLDDISLSTTSSFVNGEEGLKRKIKKFENNLNDWKNKYSIEKFENVLNWDNDHNERKVIEKIVENEKEILKECESIIDNSEL